MSCIHSPFNGPCHYYEGEFTSREGRFPDIDIEFGFDNKGNCVVEDDDDPWFLCPAFETDTPEDYEEEDNVL